jgi:hypothetical protein
MGNKNAPKREKKKPKKIKPKREDFNQAAFRAGQETIKSSGKPFGHNEG